MLRSPGLRRAYAAKDSASAPGRLLRLPGPRRPECQLHQVLLWGSWTLADCLASSSDHPASSRSSADAPMAAAEGPAAPCSLPTALCRGPEALRGVSGSWCL